MSSSDSVDLTQYTQFFTNAEYINLICGLKCMKNAQKVYASDLDGTRTVDKN